MQIEVEGKLTPQEQEALKSLAKGFDQAIQGLMGEPPALDIEGLTQFDSTLLSKVALKVDVYGLDSKGVRFLKLGTQFNADATSREIALKTPEGAVAMKTDLHQPVLWGTADQKTKAVQQYLGRIDKAATRGHADPQLMDLFKSTFTAMNAGYGVVSKAAGVDLNAAQPGWLISTRLSQLPVARPTHAASRKWIALRTHSTSPPRYRVSRAATAVSPKPRPPS